MQKTYPTNKELRMSRVRAEVNASIATPTPEKNGNGKCLPAPQPRGTYKRHIARRVELLDGIWEFGFSEDLDVYGPNSFDPHDVMAVPQAFDVTPAYKNKRGLGIYKKTIFLSIGSRALLEFESVGIIATVFVDGVEVASNNCSYLGFFAEIPVADHTSREIVVIADNRFDPLTAPLHAPYYDFRQYGGILGSVWLHEVGDRHIKTLQVRGQSPATGEITLEIEVAGCCDTSLSVGIFLDGEYIEHRELIVSNGRSVFDSRIPNPRLWTPEHPQLHLIRVYVADFDDDIQVRTGLRTVETSNGEFLLNGETIRLAGVNRHEHHPSFGSAVPVAQILADLQLLKGMGGNFVRGSHYPQTREFLDLCDELGILVWEEMLGWQQNEGHFTNSNYRDAHRSGIERMVQGAFNHPSIIMWGFLNEAETDLPAAADILQESFSVVRALDNTRPIAYATCKGTNDRFLAMADVLCFNIYPGWYGCENEDGDTLQYICPEIDRLLSFVQEKPELNGRPVIISEIGAEGIYGIRDQSAPFYSEDYQAAYIKEVGICLEDHREISGIALWHFADIQTYSGGRNLNRPRGFNNKGLFNEHRQPKLAVAAASALFRSFLQQDRESLEPTPSNLFPKNIKSEDRGWKLAV